MAAKAASKGSPEASVQAGKRLRAVAGALGEDESARLLYDRIRLGIMSALSVNRTMSFGELKEMLSTTDGNLSKHARRLEDAGLLSCKKAFSERVPRTQFSLTTKGKRSFTRHLRHMETLIEVTRNQ